MERDQFMKTTDIIALIAVTIVLIASLFALKGGKED